MKQQILLVETLSPAVANLQESKKDGKTWYLDGIFMQADCPNGNGRIYPKNILVEAVQTMNDRIIKGFNVLGELEHPEYMTINLNNVSHVVESLAWRGNDVIGRAKILDTPKGEIAKALLKEGIRLGVSSRGRGSTEYVDNITMVKSFDLITVDIVATPSAPNAYPESLQESLNSIYSDPKIVTLSEAVVGDNSAQKYFEIEIRKFLKSIIR